MPQHEVRFFQTTEVRALGGSGDADPLRISGHAAVFNTAAKLPGFREKIMPGAFTRALEERQDVVCLWNHNSDMVLGRTTSGTLRLKQDQRGLQYDCDLPNTQSARDYHETIRRGDVNGCSFGFVVAPDGQDWSEQRDEDGTFYILREIRDVKLLDVSPVTYPCYDGTDVIARSVEAPVELRAAIEAKNLANAAVIVPPAIEKRPYSSVSEVPDSVPKAKRKLWMEVWNSAYSKALKDGKSAKEAESSAFAQANGVVKESKSMDAKFEFRAVVGIDDNDIKPQDCPASWSDALKKAYCDGYNAAFAKAREAGLKGDPAIAKAVSGGMMGIHEIMARPDESGSQQRPAIQADTDNDGDGGKVQDKGRSANNSTEKRTDSIEDLLNDVTKALTIQFPRPDTAANLSSPWDGKYWVCETYNDHVIAKDTTGDSDDYVSIPYSKNGEEIKFGEPTPVEKTYVPSARAMKAAVELREDDMQDDGDVGDDDEDRDMQGIEGHDMFYLGRAHDPATLHADHIEGECIQGDCTCQNRFCPTGSGMRSARLATSFAIKPALDQYKRFDDLPQELRAGMTRTKRVSGKDLSAKSFAYVGDPNDTTTWKFPIHDASHVRNALARWGQDKGIPKEKQAGVYGKIKAAAKKFGIEVSDKDAEAARSVLDHKEIRERLAEHMKRVGPDLAVDLRDLQPRKDGGKFGTRDGEKATSADEHTAAAKDHFAMAVDHDKKKQKDAADAHKAAGQAHTEAATAKTNNGQDGTAKTDLAQAHSKIANSISKRYEGMTS